MSADIAAGLPKFMSYADPAAGYSTNPGRAAALGWTNDDRALYAATRAHASETGEQPVYVERGRDVRESTGHGDPTIDATLHSLLSSDNPAAAQALRHTGLKDVGAQAFRRHRDRQLLGEGQSTQESLFQEIRGETSGKVLGHVPNWEAANLDESSDAAFSDFFEGPGGIHPTIQRAEAASGERVDIHPMSKNQFGETPRTQEDLQESIGVFSGDSRKQGFRKSGY